MYRARGCCSSHVPAQKNNTEGRQYQTMHFRVTEKPELMLVKTVTSTSRLEEA
jgi:hypothetical protein